jgi:hypothetical protein
MKSPDALCVGVRKPGIPNEISTDHDPKCVRKPDILKIRCKKCFIKVTDGV